MTDGAALTYRTYLPPMSTTKEAHDKYLIDLANAIVLVHKDVSYSAVQNLATKWAENWEELQGKDYLSGADDDWYEKRIHTLLGLLAFSVKKERRVLLVALAHNLDSYADVVAHCPSGFFSRDINHRVTSILKDVL